MKKYISAAFIALFALATFSSCTKKADVDGIEAKLPPIQISSLGLQTAGPYSTTSVIQLLFGATLTKLTPGAFDLEIYDNTTSTQVLTQTIHFNSWAGFDSTTPATTPSTTAVGTLGTIAYTLASTTYPNTMVVNGQMLIRLSKLTSGKAYTFKAYARSADGQVSTITVSKLITLQ